MRFQGTNCTWHEADERDTVLSIQLPLPQLHLHPEVHQALEGDGKTLEASVASCKCTHDGGPVDLPALA